MPLYPSAFRNGRKPLSWRTFGVPFAAGGLAGQSADRHPGRAARRAAMWLVLPSAALGELHLCAQLTLTEPSAMAAQLAGLPFTLVAQLHTRRSHWAKSALCFARWRACDGGHRAAPPVAVPPYAHVRLMCGVLIIAIADAGCSSPSPARCSGWASSCSSSPPACSAASSTALRLRRRMPRWRLSSRTMTPTPTSSDVRRGARRCVSWKARAVSGLDDSQSSSESYPLQVVTHTVCVI